MFKIMNGIHKISADAFLRTMDSDRIRSHSFTAKKRTLRMGARQGSSTQRGVNQRQIDIVLSSGHK